MNKQLLTLISLSAIAVVSAQTPEIDAWYLNVTGASADYEYYDGAPLPANLTPVQMTDSADVKSVCYNATDVYVKSNGLASYTMGPWLDNPNVPTGQDYTFKFTRNPAQETGALTSTPFGGAIGVAVNGAVFFGYGDGKSYSNAQGQNAGNGDGNWDADAWVSEGSTMDASGGGHPTGGGKYHYHATPITLYSNAGTSHSPIIGYAFDGYPIYGPFGYQTATDASSAIIRMESGYSLRNITIRTILPDGSTSTPPGPAVTTSGSFDLGTYVQDYEYIASGTLDEYNGRYCFTPEYPTGTYAYFMTVDAALEPEFPYLLGSKYYGVASNQEVNNQGSITSPSGLTCISSTLDVNELNQDVKSQLYPNPANNKISFRFGLIAPNKLMITNTMGQIMITTTHLNDVDVSQLPKGIYNATLFFSDKSEMIRFVKQ